MSLLTAIATIVSTIAAIAALILNLLDRVNRDRPYLICIPKEKNWLVNFGSAPAFNVKIELCNLQGLRAETGRFRFEESRVCHPSEVPVIPVFEPGLKWHTSYFATYVASGLKGYVDRAASHLSETENSVTFMWVHFSVKVNFNYLDRSKHVRYSQSFQLQGQVHTDPKMDSLPLGVTIDRGSMMIHEVTDYGQKWTFSFSKHKNS